MQYVFQIIILYEVCLLKVISSGLPYKPKQRVGFMPPLCFGAEGEICRLSTAHG